MFPFVSPPRAASLAAVAGSALWLGFAALWRVVPSRGREMAQAPYFAPVRRLLLSLVLLAGSAVGLRVLFVFALLSTDALIAAYAAR